jgi:hypothetical protein
MGEDENSEDWFSSEEVFTGSFSKDFVREQLRLWGEHYLKSNNGSGTIEEKMSSICVITDTKIFLLYTILVCTVVALVILLPAVCLAPRKRDRTIMRKSLDTSNPQKNLDFYFMEKKLELRKTGNLTSFDSDMKEILQEIPPNKNGLIMLKSRNLVTENDLKDILTDSFFYKLKKRIQNSNPQTQS